MRVISLTCALLLAALLVSCKTSGPAGQYPTPTRLPVITVLTLPASPLHAGDSAQFRVTWQDGREPFQVTWTFDGGTDVDSLLEATAERMHTATVTLVNAGAVILAATGSVTIADDRGNTVSRDFSFSVEPAS